MAILRTLTLIVATAATLATALPSQDNAPAAVQVRDEEEAIPTIIRPTITRPIDIFPTGDPNLDPCATVRCGFGQICQVVRGQARCVNGRPCGPSSCPSNMYCCNSSCGICAPPGGGCITLWCGPFERE